MNDLISVDDKVAVAKYRQIVNSILNAIGEGELQVGDRIPSLNYLVKEFGLSQDTVLTAYNELKNRGIISSSVGKGYFIAKTDIAERHNIFILFDKMTSYKEEMYEAMQDAAGNKAVLDIYFHHGNQKAFNTLIENAMGNYTAYIIVPIISEATESILAQLPKKKVYIVDQGITRFGKKYRSVCQHFEKDIVNSLKEGTDRITKYSKLYLVHDDPRQQFRELEKGFRKFCKSLSLPFEILQNLITHSIQKDEMYLLVNDKDLVRIIKQSRDKRLGVGKDIGVISYNDSPFKEIIADGITCISTDFGKMGRSVIQMIFDNKTIHLENPGKLIMRNSL